MITALEIEAVAREATWSSRVTALLLEFSRCSCHSRRLVSSVTVVIGWEADGVRGQPCGLRLWPGSSEGRFRLDRRIQEHASLGVGNSNVEIRPAVRLELAAAGNERPDFLRLKPDS